MLIHDVDLLFYFFFKVQMKERENLELQSEMADARKKHEVILSNNFLEMIL